MDNSFPIFEPDNKIIRITPEFYFYVSFLVIVLIASFDIKSIQPAMKFVIPIMLIAMLALWFANGFLVSRIKGILNGTVVFTKEGIKIKNEFIPIEFINDVNLNMYDYQGRRSRIRPVTAFRTISNGTDNFLDVSVKNKSQRIKVYFQMHYQEQYQALRPFVYSLIQNNIITVAKGASLLQLDDEAYFLQQYNFDLNKKENL